MPKIITSVEWSASNIPEGLKLNKNTGVFSGTATKSGDFTVSVTVNTNYGIAVENIKINVAKPLWSKFRPFPANNYSSLRANSPIICYENASASSDGLGIFTYGPDGGSNYILLYDFNNFSYYRYANTYATGYSSSNFPSRIFCFYGGFTNLVVYGNNAIASRYYTVKDGYSYLRWSFGSNSNKVVASMKVNNLTCLGCSTGNVLLGGNTVNLGIGSINYRCVAYSTSEQVFCVTGSNKKSAVSSDGASWTISDTLPDNFICLEYRADLAKFFALGENIGYFYVSSDGINWEQYNSIPLPFRVYHSDISGTLAYDSTHGIYCVLGYGEDEDINSLRQYAYFSKDLNNWIQSKVTNDEVHVNCVVYLPVKSLFVVSVAENWDYVYTYDSVSLSLEL